ncbi:MAG: FAD-dependent oxidoreductase [Clostridia bacterium]|nr:FAD-dependent oxidoreductase [Clostridia bacterium]
MSSYWIESTKHLEKEYPSLSNNIEVDVCIIGGGLVGITSAYLLSNTNLKVAVLERDNICSHVSGNSTAKITSQHNLFYDYLINSQGRNFAKGYLKANEDAKQNIKDIIEKEKIDCDFSIQDSYVYAYSEKELEDIKKEVDAVKSLDFDCEFVSEIPLPIKTLGAIKFSNQAQFNPRKYALSLCNIVSKKGIDIYTKTVVSKVEQEDDGYIIFANDSVVHAKHVILATHYPIVNFPEFYFLKMYQSMSYVIAADTKCDLPEGMYINSTVPTYSFRTTPYKDKKLLIIAGSDHKTGEKIDLKQSYELLENKAKELYPQSEVLYRWCTEDCISLDKIPYIGDFSSVMPNLYVATGFKKWGISFSNIASHIIVDKILGKENKYEDLFKATRLEPLKNHEELGSMIKESMYSLVINKLKSSPDTLEDVGIDEGKIIEMDGEKVGVYRDKNGECFFIKPVCAHLGCELSFNNIERTWDCPCHGSRYDIHGKVISEPAIENLEKVDE